MTDQDLGEMEPQQEKWLYLENECRSSVNRSDCTCMAALCMAALHTMYPTDHLLMTRSRMRAEAIDKRSNLAE